MCGTPGASLSVETCLGLLKQPPLWQSSFAGVLVLEDSSPACPAELGKGLLAFIRVLAANSVLCLFLGRWRGSPEVCEGLDVSAQLRGKRKGGSLAGTCLWLVCFLLKVTGTRKCVFAPGRFCGGQGVCGVGILPRPGLRGGSFTPQMDRFSWDPCWCRVRENPKVFMQRHKWWHWALGGPESDAVNAGVWDRQGLLAFGSTVNAACSQQGSWGCVLGIHHCSKPLLCTFAI